MSNEYSKRNSYSLNLGRVIAKVVKPVMRQRGFYDVDIINDWENIVGPEWAKQTCPQKLNFNAHTRRSGTLHILVAPGASVLIQHIVPLIIDRVNTYFGFDAVNRIKLIHGNVLASVQPKSKKHLKVVGPLPDVGEIADTDLKTALQHLGQSLISNHENR
jgi:hypothetical protein